ncbi:MAG: DUF2286 domain-containing protein [Candidatus Verstraetearchaeota archaeon]|nr:DUF2286 domain-containing protein [Candidatus Verstraetearchaeota archaeon]
MSKTLVLRSRGGALVSKETVDGEVKDTVRKVVVGAVSLWSAETSDFIVIRDMYPVSVKLPITKEQYELYSKYDMSRTSNGSVMFSVPVYVISFDNEWQEDDYVDKEVIVVAPNVDQKVEEIITELAVEATKPKEDEEPEEDEGMEEDE